MPSEVFDENRFVELSKQAFECRVKRVKGVVKLKLRTKKRLYTIKLDEEAADSLLDNLQCSIVEV